MVGRAHGLKGAFYVTGRQEPIPPLQFVMMAPAGSLKAAGGASQKIFQVISAGLASGKPLLRLKEIDSREKAESLRGWHIAAHQGELAFDPQTEYIWHSLLGRSIVDVAGEPLGVVVKVENFNAHDIIIIHGDGRYCDIPFVRAYVEMEFDPGNLSEPLRLRVEGSAFAELWYDKPN